MSIKETAENIFMYIPAVRQPDKKVSFKTKVGWTLSMLVLYFVMTNVLILGAQAGSSSFGNFRNILAGAQGSIFQLGIMPIVTASIVLQIITGTDLLPLDLNNPRDQNLYQGLRRFLIIIMVVVNAIPIVFSGAFLQPIGLGLGLGTFAVNMIILLQISIGGLMIFYMDDVVSKWGIGSGLGLFIIAGISQRFIGGLLTEVFVGWWDIITGKVDLGFTLSAAEKLLINDGYILPILVTIGIFAIVVAAESTKVQIPIQRIQTGQSAKYDIKLIYASVLPIILVRAIQANIQFVGQGLNGFLGTSMPSWLGVYSSSGVEGGLFYILTPIYSPQDWMWFVGFETADPHLIVLRLLFDFTFMTVGGAVFAMFWIRTTNKDAEAIAKQLSVQDMEIPGFRSSPQRMERVLDRYIPYVTIIGGALIGALAVVAGMLGTIGGVSGTGLLLAVSITVKIYDQVKEELKESKYGSKYGFM